MPKLWLGVQGDVAMHTDRLGISVQSAECYVLGVVLKARNEGAVDLHALGHLQLCEPGLLARETQLLLNAQRLKFVARNMDPAFIVLRCHSGRRKASKCQ